VTSSLADMGVQIRTTCKDDDEYQVPCQEMSHVMVTSERVVDFFTERVDLDYASQMS
jgi:hypothetical protein